MRIIIVKAVIGWLFRRYKWLMIETVIGEGKHIHKNPTKKDDKKPAPNGGSQAEGAMFQPATGNAPDM